MPKMAVVSLGCSKNLVDTEIMLGQLDKKGWCLTADFAAAELILVNTCGFIESAKEESIEQILEMAAYKQTGVGVCRHLIVAGCLVQRYLKELKAEIPEVDYWIGLQELDQIAEIVKGQRIEKADASPFLNNENLERHRVTLQHTAYLKIAEGCNHRCSYCAIPVIKGKFRSREPQSIVTEAVSLVKGGVKELNIIAQDITMYGRDLSGGMNLRILLEQILEKAQPEWIRLLYAYPGGLTEDLLQLIQASPNICNYLDLPLQHINGRILRQMNRPESPELIREKLELVRSIVPEIVLRTTFIAGFPTETDAEFEELVQFVTEGRFEHVGVFAYSREEQTKAYDLEPQVATAVKESRRNRLMEVQAEIAPKLLARFVNCRQRILVDKLLSGGKAVGRTEGLAPDVDGVVYLQNYQGQSGQFVEGLITGNDHYNLYAKEILGE